ncbi:MAG TPA: Fe-S protein assembly co-chaperone HscB [Candidatus Binatia bacterium]|jgi:molecular chaperone HscB|nr:Fe-S protein assembly co-chaperone HscB [Candidatus Binatia bacterium]
MDHPNTVRCWRCAHAHPPVLFCPACQAIQLLPSRADYFSVLGVPRSPVVNEAELTQRYYDLSRRLHPDLYQTGTAEEKEASLKNTALLNRAYRTLRDLLQRSQYWLELQGEQLGKDNNRVPPELADLVFEVQEKLSEAREMRAEGKEMEVWTELGQIRADLNEQMASLRMALAENLAQWGGDRQAPTLLRDLKNLLSEIAYLRTLLRDVEKESDTQWNA